MTVKVEFDGDLPFPVEFAEYMIASAMPQDAVRYTPQTPTLEQQAQAQKNIGVKNPYIIPVYAGGNEPVIDTEFDWNELVDAVVSGRFVAIMRYNSTEEDGSISLNDGGVDIYPLSSLDIEDGVASFEKRSSRFVFIYTIYRNGTLTYDARNYDTANDKPYFVHLVHTYDEGAGKEIITFNPNYEFDFSVIDAELNVNHVVMCRLQGFLNGYGEVERTPATIDYVLTYYEGTSGYAIFSSIDEVGVSHITILKDSTTVKSQGWNYVRETDFNETVGDIEAALDGIIAIQENLMGGAAE